MELLLLPKLPLDSGNSCFMNNIIIKRLKLKFICLTFFIINFSLSSETTAESAADTECYTDYLEVSQLRKKYNLSNIFHMKKVNIFSVYKKMANILGTYKAKIISVLSVFRLEFLNNSEKIPVSFGFKKGF